MFGLFRKAKAAPSQDAEIIREKAVKDNEQAEKALMVKKLCQLGIFKLRWAQDNEEASEEDLQEALARLEGHKNEAIELARTITDQFYRDFALNNIIDACMAAGQRPQAREFFAIMKVDVARENALKEYPSLGAPPLPGD